MSKKRIIPKRVRGCYAVSIAYRQPMQAESNAFVAAGHLYDGNPRAALEYLLPLMGWNSTIDCWITAQETFFERLKIKDKKPHSSIMKGGKYNG